MSAEVNLQPPKGGTRRGGGDGWVELVTLLHQYEADDLADRLEAKAIDTRLVVIPDSRTSAIGSPPYSFVIFVRRSQLDEARFLLATVAFERPPARLRPLSMKLAGLVVAGLMSAMLLLAGILQPQTAGAKACDQGNLGGTSFRGLIIPCRPAARAR